MADTKRVPSIDALRGLVMIVMAIDHVRDYFSSAAMSFPPEDLTRTTAALFLTRWITHFCAPVFMFTAGLGAFFWMRRGHTKSELSRYLWTRGLWLVVLELTVVRFAMSWYSGLVMLIIMWALGWSMVALGFLVRLPVRVLAVFSIALIALHNLADSIPASRFGSVAWIWNILHQPGVFLVHSVPVLAGYPLLPWIAVMSAGFCFGTIAVLEPPERRRWMLRIGLATTAAFFVIRGINMYGDPAPWSSQIPGMTVLSFLNCRKYPPSLDYLLMTLGPALLLLAWLDGRKWVATSPLIVFGRVPLFYFLVHFFIIHLLTIPFALLRYGHAAFLLTPVPSLGGEQKLYPPNYGYDLWVVYLVWIGIVTMLYPLCLWFARVKERRKEWWLSYL